MRRVAIQGLSPVLGIVSMVVFASVPAWAQQVATVADDSGLTLARVRAMATATRTERAGIQLPNVHGKVYVPPQCVGMRRCPLVLGDDTDGMIAAADKYGFLISARRPLRELLGTFAIDPERIAVMGDCSTMPWVLAMVANNPNVFSRAVMTTGPIPPATGRVAPTGRTEFYIDHALLDQFPTLVTAHQLRRANHPVTVNMTPKAHGGTTYEYRDRVGQWLSESWAIPDPAARPAPDTVPEVELTIEALDKLTIFWRGFKEWQQHEGQPEAFLTAFRLAHQRLVALPYPDSEIRPVIRLMDVPTLAAKFWTIRELLRVAGLTAEQHDAYRVALFNAYAVWGEWRNNRIAVLTNTVLGKNVAFIEAHPDELVALEDTGMWVTP